MSSSVVSNVTVAKKRIKRCDFKGCGKTENDCKIVNHSCPEHHALMKMRGNANRKSSHKKVKAQKRKFIDFKLTNTAKSREFFRNHSFQNDVLKTGAVGKGKLLGLTACAGSPYLALKKYGAAFIEKGIRIDSEAQDDFMTYVTEVSKKMEFSFVGLTASHEPKFITKGNPNRFVMAIPSDDEKFYTWNHIIPQYEKMVRDLKVPNLKGKKDTDEVMKLDFNLLVIQAGVHDRQREHTDAIQAFALGNNTKKFNMVGLTAISNHSFLYVQPIGMEPLLVLVEKGDTLIVRLDIPHAGAENVTDFDNTRLHCFIEFPGMNIEEVDGYAVKLFNWQNGPTMSWDDEEFKFKVM